MSSAQSNFKDTIRGYILDIGGLLKEEIKDSRFDFGFRFLYPNERGRLMMVTQPKGKHYIEITLGTSLSPQHRQAFNALEQRDKVAFSKNLQKILFRSEIDYSYDFSQHYTIVLIDKIFIEDRTISINHLFQSIRRVYSSTMNVVFFIQEYFSETFDPSDFVLK